MVMKLQMKTKQKIGVAAIFALGFLVVIASSASSNLATTRSANISSHSSLLLQEERNHVDMHRLHDRNSRRHHRNLPPTYVPSSP